MGVGTGSVGVGRGVATGSVGVGIGRVGVGIGRVGVGTGSVGSTDAVGDGPLSDGLGVAVAEGVAPGVGWEWPAWSCEASCVIVGDSGASIWGLSAR